MARKLPGHTWRLARRQDIPGFFSYSCTRCPATALNGVALPPMWNDPCTP